MFVQTRQSSLGIYDAKNVHESSCNFGFSKVIHYIPDALTRQEECGEAQY